MDDTIVVPLSPLDNVMAHCYAKFLLCLSLKPHQSVERVYSCLQTALSMSLAQWPIYSGTVGFRQPGPQDWKPGQLEVRLPKRKKKKKKKNEQGLRDNDLFPLVLNDLRDEVSYGELRDSGFPEEDLDGRKFLREAFRLDLENGLDVVVAQANFLEGGCLLGLGVWHCVSDAYGAYNLLESWSKNCRKVQMQEGDNEWVWADSTMQQAAGLDRQVLTRLWLEEEEGRESCSDVELTKAEDGWRLLGLNPPTDKDTSQKTQQEGKNPVPRSEPDDVSTAPREMKTCVFYVSPSSFTSLRQAAANNSTDTKVSGNDAISALLWRSIMAARFPETKTTPKTTNLDDQTTIESHLDMLLDGRSHFSSKLPTSYLGNVVFFATVSLPLSTLTAASTPLSYIAQTLRTTLNTYTKAKTHQAFAIAATSIRDYTNLSYTFAGFEGANMNITSTLNVPLFHLDFGGGAGSSGMFGNGGRAESIRIPKDELDGLFRRCLVLPLREHGGFEIIVALFEDEMERLMADGEFARFAEFSCC